MKNINSHTEAKLALIEGKRIRNIRYSEDEWLEVNLAKGQLMTKDGCLHGSFNDIFWKRQLQFPERWHIVEY